LSGLGIEAGSHTIIVDHEKQVIDEQLIVVARNSSVQTTQR
jgi:hypothetical protein